jgi:hypothetical protein
VFSVANSLQDYTTGSAGMVLQLLGTGNGLLHSGVSIVGAPDFYELDQLDLWFENPKQEPSEAYGVPRPQLITAALPTDSLPSSLVFGPEHASWVLPDPDGPMPIVGSIRRLRTLRASSVVDPLEVDGRSLPLLVGPVTLTTQRDEITGDRFAVLQSADSASRATALLYEDSNFLPETWISLHQGYLVDVLGGECACLAGAQVNAWINATIDLPTISVELSSDPEDVEQTLFLELVRQSSKHGAGFALYTGIISRESVQGSSIDVVTAIGLRFRLTAATGDMSALLVVRDVRIRRDRLTPWTTVDPDASATLLRRKASPDALPSGTWWQAIAWAANVFGDESGPVCSAPFLIDNSPPDLVTNNWHPIELSNEVGARYRDVDVAGSLPLRVGWLGSIIESESAPDNLVELFILMVTERSANGPSIFDGKPDGNMFGLSSHDELVINETAKMRDGEVYFVHMAARNHAGGQSVAVSNGFLFDASAPEPRHMHQNGVYEVASWNQTVWTNDSDLAAHDIDAQSDNYAITMCWDIIEPHSVITSIEVGLTTEPPFANQVPFTEVPISTIGAHTFNFTGDGISVGVYFSLLRACSAGGVCSVLVSDGIVIDFTPPRAAYVVHVYPTDYTPFETFTREQSEEGKVVLHNGYGAMRFKWLCIDDQDTFYAKIGGATNGRSPASVEYRVCGDAECEAPLTDWFDGGNTGLTSTMPLANLLPRDTQHPFPARLHVQISCRNGAMLSDEQSTMISDGVDIDESQLDVSSGVVLDVDLHAKAEGDAGDREFINLGVVNGTSGQIGVAWHGVGATTSGAGVFFVDATLVPEKGTIPIMDWQFLDNSGSGVLSVNASLLETGKRYRIALRVWSISATHSIMYSDGFIADSSPPDISNADVADATFSSPVWCAATALHEAELCNLDVGFTDSPYPVQPSLGWPTSDDSVFDMAFIASTTSVGAAWMGIVDAESQVDYFMWGVGPCGQTQPPYIFQTVPLTIVDGQTSHAYSMDVTLVPGQRYCQALSAVSGSGLQSSWIWTSGFVVDVTPPVMLFCRDGLAPRQVGVQRDAVAFGDPAELSTHWRAEDSISGVSMYLGRLVHMTEAGVVHKPLTAWRPIGQVTEYTWTFPQSDGPKHGQRYGAEICAVNGAQLMACAVSSGAVADFTAPEGQVALSNGPGVAEFGFLANTDVLYLSWDFTEDASALFQVQFSIGTTPGGVDVWPLTDAPGMSVVEVHLSPEDVPNGSVLFLTAIGSNDAGHHVAIVSEGYVLDRTQPAVVGPLEIGKQPNEREWYTHDLNRLLVNTSVITDDVSTLEYVAGVERWDGEVYALASGWTTLDMNGTNSMAPGGLATLEQLSLVPAAQYRVHLMGMSKAGRNVDLFSNVFTVDPYPPAGGSVEVKGHRCISETQEVTCRWADFVDFETGLNASQIIVMLGTSPKRSDAAPQVVLRTPVGVLAGEPLPAMEHTFRDVVAPDKSLLYCSVVVADKSGHASAPVVGKPILVDRTPPSPPVVLDGSMPGVDSAYFTRDTGVAATWRRSLRDGSSPASLQWCAGFAPGKCELSDGWITAPLQSSSMQTDVPLDLPDGALVFISVNLTNACGLSSVASSDGSTFLDTVPSVSSLQVEALYLHAFGLASDRHTCGCMDPNAEFLTTIAECVCKPGYSLDHTPGAPTGTCVPCDVNCTRALDESSVGYCTPCQNITHDMNGIPKIDPPVLLDTCGPGFYRYAPGGSCKECPADTFKSEVGDSIAMCKPCHSASQTGRLLIAFNSTIAYPVPMASHFEIGIRAQAGPEHTVIVRNTSPHGSVMRVMLDASRGWHGVSHAATYFVSVRHHSLVQTTGASVSSGVDERLAMLRDIAPVATSNSRQVDLTPPQHGVVFDGNSSAHDIDLQANQHELGVAWRNWFDPDETLSSSFTSFDVKVAFGTRPGDSSVSGGWITVDHGVSSYTLQDLQLTDGARYFATVMLSNKVGATTVRSTDGVTVQTSLPTGILKVLSSDAHGVFEQVECNRKCQDELDVPSARYLQDQSRAVMVLQRSLQAGESMTYAAVGCFEDELSTGVIKRMANSSAQQSLVEFASRVRHENADTILAVLQQPSCSVLRGSFDVGSTSNLIRWTSGARLSPGTTLRFVARISATYGGGALAVSAPVVIAPLPPAMEIVLADAQGTVHWINSSSTHLSISWKPQHAPLASIEIQAVRRTRNNLGGHDDPIIWRTTVPMHVDSDSNNITMLTPALMLATSECASFSVLGTDQAGNMGQSSSASMICVDRASPQVSASWHIPQRLRLGDMPAAMEPVALTTEELLLQSVSIKDVESGVKSLEICVWGSQGASPATAIDFTVEHDGVDWPRAEAGCAKAPGPLDHHRKTFGVWEWSKLRIRIDSSVNTTAEPVHVYIQAMDLAGVSALSTMPPVMVLDPTSELLRAVSTAHGFCHGNRSTLVMLLPHGPYDGAADTSTRAQGTLDGGDVLALLENRHRVHAPSDLRSAVGRSRWSVAGCGSTSLDTHPTLFTVNDDDATLTVLVGTPGLVPATDSVPGSAHTIMTGFTVTLEKLSANAVAPTLYYPGVELGEGWFEVTIPVSDLNHGATYESRVEVATVPAGKTVLHEPVRFSPLFEHEHLHTTNRMSVAVCSPEESSDEFFGWITPKSLEKYGLQVVVCLPTTTPVSTDQLVISSPSLSLHDTVRKNQFHQHFVNPSETPCGIAHEVGMSCVRKVYVDLHVPSASSLISHELLAGLVNGAGVLAGAATNITVLGDSPLLPHSALLQPAGAEGQLQVSRTASLPSALSEAPTSLFNTEPQFFVALDTQYFGHNRACGVSLVLQLINSTAPVPLGEVACGDCDCLEQQPVLQHYDNVSIQLLNESSSTNWVLQISILDESLWPSGSLARILLTVRGPSGVRSHGHIKQLVSWTPDRPSLVHFRDGLGQYSLAHGLQTAILAQPTRYTVSDEQRVMRTFLGGPPSVNVDADLNCAPRRGASLLPTVPVVGLTAKQAIQTAVSLSPGENTVLPTGLGSGSFEEEHAGDMCVNLERLLQYSMRHGIRSGVPATPLVLSAADPLALSLSSIRCDAYQYALGALDRVRRGASPPVGITDITSLVQLSYARDSPAVVVSLNLYLPATPQEWVEVAGLALRTTNSTVYGSSWDMVLGGHAGIGALWWRLLDANTQRVLVPWIRMSEQTLRSGQVQSMVWPPLAPDTVVAAELAVSSGAACGPRSLRAASCEAEEGPPMGAGTATARTNGLRLTCLPDEDCPSSAGHSHLFTCL